MIKILKISSIITLACFAISSVLWKASNHAKPGMFSGESFKEVAKKFVEHEEAEKKERLLISKSMSAQGFDKVDIDYQTVDIKVKASADDQVQIEYYGDKKVFTSETLKIDVADGVLKIVGNDSESSGWCFFCFGDSKNNELIIKVPKTIKEVKTHTISGDIRVSDVNLLLFYANTTSGDLRFIDSDIERVELKNVSGDLKFSGDFKYMNFNTVSGDVKIKVKNPAPDLSVSTVSGEVDLNFVGPPDALLDFQTTSGSYKIGGGTSTVRKTEESQGGAYKYSYSYSTSSSAAKGDGSFTFTMGKAATGKINVKTVSGDLRIRDNAVINHNDGSAPDAPEEPEDAD